MWRIKFYLISFQRFKNYLIIFCHQWNLFKMLGLPVNIHSNQGKNKSNGTKFHKKVSGTKINTLSSGILKWEVYSWKQSGRTLLMIKWLNFWAVWVPQDKTSDNHYIHITKQLFPKNPFFKRTPSIVAFACNIQYLLENVSSPQYNCCFLLWARNFLQKVSVISIPAKTTIEGVVLSEKWILENCCFAMLLAEGSC